MLDYAGRLGRRGAPGDARSATRIVVGHIRGGFASWTESGAPIETGGRLTVDQLAARLDAGRAGRAVRRSTSGRLSEYERRARPGLAAHRRGRPPGAARRAAARPADRDDLRVRLPGERRRVAAAGRRFQRRQLGRRRRCPRGRPMATRSSAARARQPRPTPDATGGARRHRRPPAPPPRPLRGTSVRIAPGWNARVPCGHAESRSQAALATIPRSLSRTGAVADANRWRKQCFDRPAATRDRSSACSPSLLSIGLIWPAGHLGSRRHERRGAHPPPPRAPSARRRSGARARSRSTQGVAAVPRSPSRSPASTPRTGRAPRHRHGLRLRTAAGDTTGVSRRRGPRHRLRRARGDVIRPVGGHQPDSVRLRAARPVGRGRSGRRRPDRQQRSSGSRTARARRPPPTSGCSSSSTSPTSRSATDPIYDRRRRRPALACTTPSTTAGSATTLGWHCDDDGAGDDDDAIGFVFGAISTTGDPTGDYYHFYILYTGFLPDYPIHRHVGRQVHDRARTSTS